MAKYLKLTVDTVHDKDIWATKDDYVTDGNWILTGEYVGFDNFRTDPENEKDETLLDKFLSETETVKVSLGFYRGNPFIKSISDAKLAAKDVIPKEDDLFEEWDVLPVLFPDIDDPDQFVKLGKHNRDSFFMVFYCYDPDDDEKVYIRVISYLLYQEITKLGLSFVPNKKSSVRRSGLTVKESYPAPFAIAKFDKNDNMEIVGAVACIGGFEKDILKLIGQITKYSKYRIVDEAND